MQNDPGRKCKSRGHFYVSRLTAPELSASVKKFRSGCCMNGTIDASTSEQAAVGRVDNRIDIQPGYIRFYDLDHVQFISF
jgi:hypothetical protein